MAGATRTDAHVIEWLSRLESEPHEFGFVPAVRKLECIYADKPRLGDSARSKDDAVRLGQDPSLAFAPRSIASFRSGSDGQPDHLECYFFGLFGPNGPMPLHLSEFVHSRELNYGDRTFRSFADTFHHRMLSLFYRATADSEPTICLDRPEENEFDLFVGAVLGIGPRELRGRDAMSDDAKRYHAGHLSLQTRPAEGLVDLLEDYFGLPFEIRELVGEWLALAEEDRMVLQVDGSSCRLGRDTILGREIWNCQHRFRIICGPLQLEDFMRLLPGGDSVDGLLAVVRNYLGDEFAWDLNLVLLENEVPGIRLGEAGQLGWTTWLGNRTVRTHADEVLINIQARATQEQTH